MLHRRSLLGRVGPIVRSPATGSLPIGYRPPAVLEFRILGPLEVGGENGTIQLGGPRQRATLAILLLHANRVVPVEQLADDLYAGRPPVTAVTQVQRQVSELRRALGSAGAIETRPPGYVLRRSRPGLRPCLLRAPDSGSRARPRARGRCGGGRSAGRGALALAGAAARRPRLRAVRPCARRTAGRASPHGTRGADRRRAHAWAARNCRERARGPRGRAPAAGAAARTANAGALPFGTPSRRARGLPRDAGTARVEL